MGTTCSSSPGLFLFCSPSTFDQDTEQIQKRRARRNTQKLPRKLPPNSVAVQSKKPLKPIKQCSPPESADNVEMKADLFGVDGDTLRLLLKLDDMNSINENSFHQNMDIDLKLLNLDLQSKQCLSDPSQKDTVFTAEYSSDDSSDDIFYDESSHNRKKSHLISIKCNDCWESDEFDDLELEMKVEYRRLSERSHATLSCVTSNESDASCANNASLFRFKSAANWDVDDINTQREEIEKEILHLRSHNSATSNR